MQGSLVFKSECGTVIKPLMFLLQVYWFGPIVGALLATGIHHLANNFPVTTADDLVITGQELNDIADPDKKEDTGQTPRKYDTQTQTPYELNTTV